MPKLTVDVRDSRQRFGHITIKDVFVMTCERCGKSAEIDKPISSVAFGKVFQHFRADHMDCPPSTTQENRL
jgi:hypothetical protein